MTDAVKDKSVCTECIGNKQLSFWIKTHGEKGRCDFEPLHAKRNKVISVDALTEQVDEFFRERYGHGSEYVYSFWIIQINRLERLQAGKFIVVLQDILYA